MIDECDDRRTQRGGGMYGWIRLTLGLVDVLLLQQLLLQRRHLDVQLLTLLLVLAHALPALAKTTAAANNQ